jgi:hypothetical protein
VVSLLRLDPNERPTFQQIYSELELMFTAAVAQEETTPGTRKKKKSIGNEVEGNQPVSDTPHDHTADKQTTNYNSLKMITDVASAPTKVDTNRPASCDEVIMEMLAADHEEEDELQPAARPKSSSKYGALRLE